MRGDAYLTALKLLATRDLSSRELRDRLLRRGHDPAHVSDAVDRLTRERALDDGRVARARARAAIAKGRGRERVLRELQAAGIERGTAREATAATFAEVDEADLLERAIARRLRGPIQDRAHFRRLFQALLRQGFAAERIASALERRGRLDED